jgi:hypothetical protein
MAQKWTIRALTEEEYPGTQLQYEVRDETEVVSLHFWEEDAQQMAAFPLMLKALYEALDHIQFGMTPEKDVLQRITAALAAAKEE